MSRTFKGQKAGLTRAQKAGPVAVIEECRRVVAEWASDEWREAYGTNSWPDNWHKWNVALGDASGAVARERGSWAGLPMDMDDL
jgi:hypothetical protein